MTDKQKQHLLAYLGYYVGTIDGIFGSGSREATKAFQRSYGLEPDGIFGNDTEAKIKEVIYKELPPLTEPPDISSEWVGKYFTRDELKCKCGGRYCNGFPAEPKEMLVKLADRAREHFGRPAYNISCLRCRQHNANEGGVEDSQHMYGEAMDIRIDGVSGDTLLEFFLAQPEVRYAYKINSTNVHFDIPKGAR